MNARIPGGVWPTMITPFTADGEVDHPALERLVEWYLEHGVSGLFAVCQSSEMVHLTGLERLELARTVCALAKGRVPIVAAVACEGTLDMTIDETRRISETGVEAVVLITNRFAAQNDGEDVWKRNIQRLIDQLPDVNLGLYECPHPYKRLLSPATLEWCASTNRFSFFKETSCDIPSIHAKLDAIRSSGMRLFNANGPTLLESLKAGAAGYCGILANFCPQLIAWLLEHWKQEKARAEALQSFLGVASAAAHDLYPANAKYFLSLEDLPLQIHCRCEIVPPFSQTDRLAMEQFHSLTRECCRQYLRKGRA